MTISILMIAIICVELGRAGIQLAMVGIEHDPTIMSILFHTLTHNDAEHFGDNFWGLFIYFGLIGIVSHFVDTRQNNLLFVSGMITAVSVSTMLGLFVWPNDGGIAGASGILHFLMGYFWIGCFSIYCFSLAVRSRLRVRKRVDRLLQAHPFIVPAAILMVMVVLHWIFDDFESLRPSGQNALGKLYHLVGLIIGIAVGVLSFSRWIKDPASQ